MTKPHISDCPLAGMLNIFGDRWSWLIIREAFYGVTRFSDFERNTGIAKNLLADRLSQLVEHGLLTKKDIGERGTRHAYHLTPKGESLHVPMMALFQWGNAHLFGDAAPPIRLVEKATGQPPRQLELLSQDGVGLSRFDLKVVPGPTARPATRERFKRTIDLRN